MKPSRSQIKNKNIKFRSHSPKYIFFKYVTFQKKGKNGTFRSHLLKLLGYKCEKKCIYYQNMDLNFPLLVIESIFVMSGPK